MRIGPLDLEDLPESIRDSREKAQDHTSRYFASSEAHLGVALLELSDSEALLKRRAPQTKPVRAEWSVLTFRPPEAVKLSKIEI